VIDGMKKKIKSFTLDGEIYDSLVAIFKKHKVEGSLSLFVHNSLKELLTYITEIKKELEIRRHDYNVPLSYIIEEIIKNPLLVGRTESEEYEDPKSEDGYHFISKYEIDAEEWNDKYEAEKMRVSLEFYAFLKTGLYEPSANRKYLIHNRQERNIFLLIGIDS
jgi:hypothetical protein